MCAQEVVRGIEYVPGAPPLLPIRVVRLGGVMDTVTRKITGETSDPIIWYVGERQAKIVLKFYNRDSDGGTRMLLYSAEGGGKTVLMAQSLIAFALGLTMSGQAGAIGATAPTHERLQSFVKAVSGRIPIDTVKARVPASWGTYYSEERELRLVTGHVVQFRSTKKQSDATGSPIQGFTWLASFDDELQDTAANGADPDIEARLRGSRVSFRLTTATAKDSPSWRTFRDEKQTSPDWAIERLKYSENPFVWAEHWERMRRNMSPRDWQRRGLALDVGPERMTYTTWERAKNLLPIPQLGAVDATAEVLAPWGRNLKVLVGHDPGKLVNYSLLLKAYRLRGRPEINWWVVGELASPRSTTEEHAKALVNMLRKTWGINRVGVGGRLIDGGDAALVRADPYSDSGNDSQRPDRSVYTLFKAQGLHIMPASTRTKATPNGVSSSVATIPKDAGIEIVVSLLANANGERRLFVACDDRRQPLAPLLVESLELSERDSDGKAETQKKNDYDLSHPTAALRYALYEIERPRAKAAG